MRSAHAPPRRPDCLQAPGQVDGEDLRNGKEGQRGAAPPIRPPPPQTKRHLACAKLVLAAKPVAGADCRVSHLPTQALRQSSDASELHSPQIFSLELSQNFSSLARRWSGAVASDADSLVDDADVHRLLWLSRPQTDFEAQVRGASFCYLAHHYTC